MPARVGAAEVRVGRQALAAAERGCREAKELTELAELRRSLERSAKSL